MSSPPRVFVDTNVLVYDVDVSEPLIQRQASQLLQSLSAQFRPVISTQVVNGYVNITSRKLKPALSLPLIQYKVSRYLVACDVTSVSPAIIMDAFRILSSRRVSWWDALVHASALASNVSDVLSEDLIHLGTIDGITYHDPFSPSFDVQNLLQP